MSEAPIVYHYHRMSGEYLSSSLADADPMESGRWVVPASATLVEPATTSEGFATVFVDGEWREVEDHRGEAWWDENGNPVDIDFLGDPADRGLTDVAPEPEPEPDPVTVVYPVDLWSRLTNAEAEAVEAAMTTQPIRVQNIFRAASSYRSDHELWPLLKTMAVGLFGAERAAVILAAS